LLIVLKINPWPITFIENVENKRLAKFLQRKGWMKTFLGGSEYDNPPSFYKKDTSKQTHFKQIN
jgi:hypothetical protein